MKRPDALLDSVSDTGQGVDPSDVELLRRIAKEGLARRRVPRIDGAERAPSGRARCRHCKEIIENDVWRIRLVFYEEGMFNPAGFIHLTCSGGYFETDDIVVRLAHFSPHLTGDDLMSIEKALKRVRPQS